MSVANKIFSNTIWQVAIRGTNIFLGVISLGLITRILGPVNFGFYTTIFAFAQVMMIMADLGLYLTLLREISSSDAAVRRQKIVNNIFTIRVVTALVFVLLSLALIQFFPYEAAVKQGLLFIIFSFFFQSLISTMTAVFAKEFAMPKAALTDLLNKAVYLGLLIWLFFSNPNLNYILAANTFSQFIAFVLLWIFMNKYGRLNLAWDLGYWRQVLKKTWPLAITVVLNLLYFKADTLVLSFYYPPEIVGFYGAPYRVLEALAAFPHMFMGLILPLLTAAWVSQQPDKFRQIFQHSFDFFAALGFGLIALMWLVSKPLMIALAGQEFIQSAPILNILIVATVIIFFGVLFTYLVVALDRQRAMVKYFLLVALFGLGGYFIFIPRFSYWGAAYMTVAVELLITVFAYFVVRRDIVLQIKFKIFKNSFFSAVLALLISWPAAKINITLAAGIFCIVYLATLYFTKSIDPEQIKKLTSRKI